MGDRKYEKERGETTTMVKQKESWVCIECGCTQSKWVGSCPVCREWNTMQQFSEPKEVKREYFSSEAKPVSSIAVPQSDEMRIPTGLAELDRVLGGGAVEGSFTLLGGDPGIGKSTLMLGLSGSLCRKGKKVLYVTGEESLSQTGQRARRLKVAHDDLYLFSETSFAKIEQAIDAIQPDVLVIDSIQIVYKPEIPSLPGSVVQVKEIAMQCMHIAKQKNITTFVIGHVTKGGDIAGPKILEHIVDTVLEFEGDKDHGFRMIRTHKNRFGPTDEVAVMQMEEDGLKEVHNPSKMFLQERVTERSGSVVGATMQGSRAILVEVQALVTTAAYSAPSRKAIGVDTNRLAMLLAVLEKGMGYQFGNQDVFLSIAGGIKVKDPALDLAIVLALASSRLNVPFSLDCVAIGEVGLSGEIRSVPRLETRIKEAKHLGFSRAMIPKKHGLKKNAEGTIRCIGAAWIRDVLTKENFNL